MTIKPAVVAAPMIPAKPARPAKPAKPARPPVPAKPAKPAVPAHPKGEPPHKPTAPTAPKPVTALTRLKQIADSIADVLTKRVRDKAKRAFLNAQFNPQFGVMVAQGKKRLTISFPGNTTALKDIAEFAAEVKTLPEVDDVFVGKNSSLEIIFK